MLEDKLNSLLTHYLEWFLRQAIKTSAAMADVVAAAKALVLGTEFAAKMPR